MANMLTLSIDGKPCTVPKGTFILDACRQIGIEIPTLCHLKELAPDGSCRMCVVEHVGGRKGGLPTACSTYCTDGMELLTRSEKVVQARRFVLDLLLSNHATNCFACPANGGCKLQEYCLEYGVEQTSYLRGKRQPFGGADDSDPFFTYKPELCIMCRRCTRTCQHLQGRDVISVSQRGFGTVIKPSGQQPWATSPCESCGNCVQACPTGALSMKVQKNYRTFEVEKTTTTCPHCAVGCQLNLLTKKGRIVGAEAVDGPANKGQLCVKGRFGSYRFVDTADRLRSPLIKENGAFREASWEEALDLMATKMGAIKAAYGPDAIAGFSCARSPNEDNYMFQKMMRTAFGTNTVDNCARVCHSPSVAGLATTLGSGAMTNPFTDIVENAEVILLVGSNPEEAHPVFGARLRRAVREGAKLIVVDPRKIDLAKRAAIHLQLKPGTNVAFANGMMHIIIKEGLADMEFIRSRTEGYEEIARIVKEYPPEKVAKICGVEANDLREAALLYARAKRAAICYCLGVTEHSTGTEGVMSLSNLAMLVGKIGRKGCGINPIRGQNNVQGACDMGALPGDYPGYQKVADPDARHKFEAAWGVALNPSPGLTATQVPQAVAEGKIKALYIFGEDPMRTDPDLAHIQAMLEQLDFFVIQELFLTETARFADVVLPGLSYAEKEGTFTNSERRVQRVRKAVSLTGQMRADTDIFTAVMNRMGYPQKSLTAAQIMQEIASLAPPYAGISHVRLDAGETLHWPCKNESDPGTAILHQGTFARGLGYFYPAQYKAPAETASKDYPFTLITGRMLYHYNAGAMTQRTEGLNELAPKSYIEMHQKDAEAMGIKNGDRVKVASRRGEVETTARVGTRVKPKEVFMTFHFQDANANWLTNPATDTLARTPEYKVAAVRVHPVR